MQKILSVCLFIFAFAAAPVFGLPAAGDKAETIATKMQQKLSTVSPHVVVVVVDSRDNSAYVSGTVSSQEEADRITSMIRSMENVNLVNSDLSVSSSGSMGTTGHGGHGSSTAGSTGSTSGSQTGSDTSTSDTDATGTTTMDNTGSTGTADTSGSTDPSSAGQPSTGSETTGGEMSQSGSGSQSDASITQAVQEAFRAEGMQGENMIRVETEKGVVTLTGTALSEAQADRLVELARSVPGVMEVNPNLQLRDEQRRYTPAPSEERDKEGRDVDDAESEAETEDDDEEEYQ